MADDPVTRAEIRLPTLALRDDLPFFTERLGFRLEQIYPADDPRVAVISGHGLRLRLETGATEPPGTIVLRAEHPDRVANGAGVLTAPNGTRVEIVPLHRPLEIPPAQPRFAVRRLRDRAPWVVGRAGMHYRDLVPDRMGGAIICSHIRIPDGGPVPDMVHYHTVGFQLIFCYRGWVDLVYEDQGPPFRLEAGNCVIQPPEIRHRVLHASEGIEVIEVGVPAEHMTTIDHSMTLPNGPARPDRRFAGQRFVHHRADEATWEPHRLLGYRARDTGIAEATQGVAGVWVVRRGDGVPSWQKHDADILFGFVMEGTMVLESAAQPGQPLEPGDAFVVPPGLSTRYSEATEDFELLEVSLPGKFATERPG